MSRPKVYLRRGREDEIAEQQGQEFTSVRLGGNAAGPISRDTRFYNSSYSLGRRFADQVTLLNAGEAALASAGVARDSVTRLLEVLQVQQVPVRAANRRDAQVQDQLAVLANADFVPSASGTGHSFTLGALANYSRQEPIGLGRGALLAVPARGGAAERWSASISAGHTNYFGFGVLSRTSLGLSVSQDAVEPYLHIPQGNVRVSSLLPDGGQAVSTLMFGGSPFVGGTSSRAIQLANQLSWYSGLNRHTIKLTSSVATEHSLVDSYANSLGTFWFNSIAELEARTASAFSRTTSPVPRKAGQLTAALSLSDSWRPTRNVQLQYGLRADANRFIANPEPNPALHAEFGIRNYKLPNRVYLSPRVGVQWQYGSAPQVAHALGGARPPRATLRGGIGIFQNVAPANLVTQAVTATGLPNTTLAISCAGAAVPVPDWGAFLDGKDGIPNRCADGTAGGRFATLAPNATAFAHNFMQAKALRAAADWTGPVLDNRFVLGVQSVLSWHTNQAGTVDLNFDPQVRFSLANEAGRPVFVDPVAIVPGTGSSAVGTNRKSAEFARVSEVRSELRSFAQQLTINVRPVTTNPRTQWDLTFNLLDVRTEFYGFMSTVGSPFDIQRGPPLAGGRYQAMLGWRNYPIRDLLYITAAVQVRSGIRFTPMISGDANGDGVSSNDRAFIFNPQHTADAPLAAAMQSLLDGGAPAARECLARQMNRLATHGSCQTPWTATGLLGIRFNPLKIGLPKRTSVHLNITNPLGILDLALHDRRDIRGWGQAIQPDRNLLFVRGFDPATNQFRYEVNQRFGSTRPTQTTMRVLPYISATVSIDVGAPRERQVLTERLDLGRSRPGAKESAEMIKAVGSSTIPNPMAMILQQAGELALSVVQADSLATLSRRFAVFADSVWTPVARHLATLPESYDRSDAYRRYVRAREETVDLLIALAPSVRSLLSASQRRKLPPQIADYLDARVLKFLRSSSAGDASAMVSRR